MEVFDISKFDEYREDNRREVKKAKGGLPNSLWETYSSMSNSNGGVIILGVVENADGSFITTGLQNAAHMKKAFWDTINNPNKVSVNLLTDKDVETYDLNGDIIMVIYVPRATREQRPVYINNNLWNGTYRRNWEGDYHCTQSEIKAMLRDSPDESIDMIVLEDFTLDDLNENTIQAYRNYHSSVRHGHVWENLPNEDYLERIGAAGHLRGDNILHPTSAGLLMFGEEYRIVRYFPEYFLDYRELLDPSIRWTDRIQSSSGDWTGNLYDFFFRVYNKLVMDIKKPFALNGISRVDDTSVHKAIREALVNCIVNYDFYLPQGLVIIKSKDKIVMQNPGGIRTGKEQMLRGGISDPRNKALMKMFNLLAFGERAGSGVPDIYSTWANAGWNDPVVEEQYHPDRTSLTLYFTKKQTNNKGNKNSSVTNSPKTLLNKSKITQYLSSHNGATSTEIAEHINLSISRTRALLTILLNEQIITTIGTGRSRKYYVNS